MKAEEAEIVISIFYGNNQFIFTDRSNFDNTICIYNAFDVLINKYIFFMMMKQQ